MVKHYGISFLFVFFLCIVPVRIYAGVYESDFVPVAQEKDSMAVMFQSSRMDSASVYSLKRRLSSLMEQGKIAEAIDLANKGILWCDELRHRGDPGESRSIHTIRIDSLWIDLHILLGAAYEESGLRTRAMNVYQTALQFALDRFPEGTFQIALLYNNIANVYYQSHNYEKAEKLWYEAVAMNKRMENPEELINNYNNIAGLYFSEKKYEKTLELLFLAQHEASKLENRYNYYFIRSNIAYTYYYLDQPDLALRIEKESLAWYDSLKNEILQAESNAFIAQFFDAKGQKDSAVFYAQKALSIARSTSSVPTEAMILESLCRIYAGQGAYKDAYMIQLRRQTLKDSLHAVEIRQQLSNIESVYELEQKAKERELVIQQLTIQNMENEKKLLYLIGCSFFILVVMIAFFFKYRTTVKMKKASESLLVRQNKVYEKEKEVFARQKQDLLDSLELKNKELTSKVLFLLKTNEFIIGIGKSLQELLNRVDPREEQANHIRTLIIKLRNQSNENSYTEFRYYFEQIHASFYTSLQEQFPHLTQKDLRLCAFLHLGLTNKEIATISFRETRSVESAKNRLKRKLGLRMSDSISDFLRRF